MTTIGLAQASISHTLRYHSRRTEIWRWYWRMWRRLFWVIHVLVAAEVAGFYHLWRPSSSPYLAFAVALPSVVACLAAFPQIMFKSQERVLILSENGWSTTIGRQSGTCAWKQICRVADTPQGLVITGRSGSAMIVPERAFIDHSQRADVVADVQRWFAAART